MLAVQTVVEHIGVGHKAIVRTEVEHTAADHTKTAGFGKDFETSLGTSFRLALACLVLIAFGLFRETC